LYGDGEAAGEGVKKGRRKKERTEKRNRDEVQKISLPLPYFLLCFSPLVCSLFCRNSAASFSFIILCFHCIIYCPWSVFNAGNNQPIDLVSELGSKKELTVSYISQKTKKWGIRKEESNSNGNGQINVPWERFTKNLLA
jgi:hypothetical protein